MKKHAGRWLKPLVMYGVGFGLLTWVVSKYWATTTNPDTGLVTPGLGDLLGGPVALEWLAAAVALIATAAALQIYRWYLLVRALDLPFAVRDAFRLSFVGIFYNTFIPGSVSGDLVKAYFIAHAHPERKSRAVASILADRTLGLFGLILFVAVVGLIAWQVFDDPRLTANPGLQKLVRAMAWASGASVALFVALGYLPRRRADRFAGRLKSVPKLGNALAEIWYAVWEYRQRPRVVALGLLLSAASHVGLVFAFHSASRLFPPADPAAELATAAEHAVLAPIGFIVQAVPIAPGGVGVGEAAFAGLYKLSGRPESRGVVARLSFRLGEWFLGLTGYLVYLRMRSEVRELEHEASEDESKVDGPQNQKS